MKPSTRQLFQIDTIGSGDPNLNADLDDRRIGLGYCQADVSPNLVWRKNREGADGWDFEREVPSGM